MSTFSFHHPHCRAQLPTPSAAESSVISPSRTAQRRRRSLSELPSLSESSRSRFASETPGARSKGGNAGGPGGGDAAGVGDAIFSSTTPSTTAAPPLFEGSALMRISTATASPATNMGGAPGASETVAALSAPSSHSTATSSAIVRCIAVRRARCSE